MVSDVVCFLPCTLFISGVEGETGVLSSPWKLGASDEFTVPFGQERF